MNQFEMKQKAYQSNLKNRALQVLLYLIDRSNKEHTCFPAVSTIGRELHISVSTVKRAMKDLVEAGYVRKESRFRETNGGQTSNLYTLCLSEENEEPQLEKLEREAKKVKDKKNGNAMAQNKINSNVSKGRIENAVNDIVKKREKKDIRCGESGRNVRLFYGIIEYPSTIYEWTGEGFNMIPP